MNNAQRNALGVAASAAGALAALSFFPTRKERGRVLLGVAIGLPSAAMLGSHLTMLKHGLIR